MNNEPVEHLERRAVEERHRLHETAGELKEKVAQTREQLSVHQKLRQHFVGVSAAVSVASFLLGYKIAGLFTQR
jgi:hypothetical protein